MWWNAEKTIVKIKFWQINDKRFYFPDGIVSLPLSHPSLKELKKDQRTERYFWEEKEKLLEIGNRVSESNKCLFLYHEILMSKPKSFNLDHKENFEQKNIKLIPRIQKILLWKNNGEQRRLFLWRKVWGKYIHSWAIGVWKTTFIQNLAKNGMFEDIKKTYWVSKISLSLEEKKI